MPLTMVLSPLEEYHKRLVKENPDLTDDQKLQLENVLTAWKKTETAESEDDVRLLVRDEKMHWKMRLHHLLQIRNWKKSVPMRYRY